MNSKAFHLDRLPIGRRLALVLGIILLLTLLGSLFAIAQLRTVSREVALMVGNDLTAERRASDWYLNVYGGVQRAAAIAKSSDPSLADYFAPFSAEAVRQTNELQKQLEQQMDTPAERALFEKIAAARKTYLTARDEVYRLKKEGDSAGALKAFTEQFDPGSAAYLAMVRQLVDAQRQQLDEGARRIEELRVRTTWLVGASVAASLALSVLLAWLLTGSITGPLRSAERMAQAIADMDLRGAPQARYAGDETGRLLRALDAMRTALQQSLNEVRGVVDGISTASSQIASGNHDLSARTEAAASSLQQTAGSMEELTGTVAQTADSARAARQLASSAAEAAREGGSVVGQVVATMEQINDSSRRIGDIIGVIDGIAFQTNILALNAAVEAARAGEQGRGFAVVASEVRSLAQRSAGAAREIKSLIGASVERVEAGSALVRQAGGTMAQLVERVRRVNEIVGEITTAAGEQSQGIAQVNVAVGQLDQMTQQNAALVEESSAATESLREQAERLSAVVGVFRLG
ncbi:methyl-accepting chemotaxis protein [Pelomonas sp. KK5]|uniref:methyl-accepting chemotaxis protein n=1 Tax=Pelomonas sp. KK5 TaxID=1855730 RepID=UPI00097C94E9|nr:methyl-accepting chemotaxis protein [Pelomonas sp. KK5]